MTEPAEDAHVNSGPPKQPRRNSRKASSPLVHDATVTRRPRLPVASKSRPGVEASTRDQKRLSVTSIPPKQAVTPTTTPRTKSAATLQNVEESKRTSQDTQLSLSQVQPKPSAIFSRTIQDLEDLLSEALQIARVAADDHEADTHVAAPMVVNTLAHAHKESPRTLLGDVKAASDGQMLTLKSLPKPHGPLVAADRTHFHDQDSIKPCGPAHQGGLGVKSSVAEPQVSYVLQQDWAQPAQRHKFLQPIDEPKRLQAPETASVSLKEPLGHVLRRQISKQDILCQGNAIGPIKRHIKPPILPRSTSKRARRPQHNGEDFVTEIELGEVSENNIEATAPQMNPSPVSEVNTTDRFQEMFGLESSHTISQGVAEKHSRHIDLNGCRHVDVQGSRDFNVHTTWKHQPVARDWEISRKRFAATIACINTSLIGIIIGIYAGEVPAIQYVIVDLDHSTILGNVVLYLGLAIPTLFLWPLPLMHGRKPYTIMALALAMCLQIPQGIAVSDVRSPYVSTYRKILLLSRAVSGFALGFVNINLQATLLDLFGASLQSGNPHQEVVDLYDVRRHGGGMGLWLGLWSWCSVGSISIGFFIGTLVVDSADVTWGFWISLLLIMVVLLLNVIGPEVRRSAYRRTVAEVKGEEGHINRVSRGEVKMHLRSAGPYWWGEEVKAGVELCWRMFQQPGFAVLAIYTGWAYAHFTLILMLLGALASRYYRLKPVYVGLCVLALGIGAMLATPFQKASFFSRARHHRQRTDSMTFQKSVVWSSHIVRRSIFTLLLPFAGLAYAVGSRGPSISVAVPTVCAGCVGFLSNLAIAECQGIIMETFDTSDLQPGMTGRPARRTTAREREQRTNFSCYPRVSAGFAISQSVSFCFAAIATGVCGRVERRLGAMQATGVVAGVLMGLTLSLTMVLFRFRVVRMIPDPQPTIDYITRSKTGWEPVVLGHPSGTTRKISILEAGEQTRWSEIRRRNRLTC